MRGYRNACMYEELLLNVTISSEKVLKVLNPPQNPEPNSKNNNRFCSFICDPAKNPNIKQASIFDSSVPIQI